VINLLSALLTPLIAITTTFIAVQQWRLERYKWRLAIYEKRFETYRAVVEFISLMCTAGDCSEKERVNFLQHASRNYFLFEPDIQGYIEELYKQSAEKSHLDQTILNSRAESQDAYRAQLAQKAANISRWFVGQFDVAKERFGEYLEIHQR
jgi:hypothetical protein